MNWFTLIICRLSAKIQSGNEDLMNQILRPVSNFPRSKRTKRYPFGPFWSRHVCAPAPRSLLGGSAAMCLEWTQDWLHPAIVFDLIDLETASEFWIGSLLLYVDLTPRYRVGMKGWWIKFLDLFPTSRGQNELNGTPRAHVGQGISAHRLQEVFSEAARPSVLSELEFDCTRQ